MRTVIFSAIALALAGCGESGVNTRNFAAPSGSAAPAEKAAARPEAGDPLKAAAAGRKIIYNARVDLVTEDLSAFESKLHRLVAASKGYVADSQVSGKAGDRRDATWKVRVPVDAYDSFLAGAKSLGELVSVKADAQDVSEEYFDVEARLANKKVEEQRLIKLLTDATGKLEEILKVEHELSRVREEVERFEGRLRALANLTSLTTVTISARRFTTTSRRRRRLSRRGSRGRSAARLTRSASSGKVSSSVSSESRRIPAVAVVAIPLLLARRRIRRWLTTPLTPFSR